MELVLWRVIERRNIYDSPRYYNFGLDFFLLMDQLNSCFCVNVTPRNYDLAIMRPLNLRYWGHQRSWLVFGRETTSHLVQYKNLLWKIGYYCWIYSPIPELSRQWTGPLKDLDVFRSSAGYYIILSIWTMNAF